MKHDILFSLVLVTFSLSAGCAEPDLDESDAAENESAADVDEVVSEAEQALTGPTVVAWTAPGGLLQSTGNLYWTANSFSEFGGYYAAVYRAGKGNAPGSELILHQESSPNPVTFGDITYALVGGSWYGYFVSNSGGVSHIKRVPLTGGAAVVLATSPAEIGGRQTLDTDGTYLYWADAAGVYKMPMGGGAVTTLAGASGVVSLGLDAANVYYAAGLQIYAVSKSGGFVAAVANATNVQNINAIFVKPGSPTELFWAEEGRIVARKPLGGTTNIVQSRNDFWRSTSVSFDGSRVLWTECTTVNNNNCTAKSKLGQGTPVSVTAGVGANFIQGDAGSYFFGNLSALYRVGY
ncbi:MAG: hypothetical protein HOW73_45345 [Polyangiaceae bacterium]|nr:hypothetical protein [Polyangiaceae bacterium]